MFLFDTNICVYPMKGKYFLQEKLEMCLGNLDLFLR